MVPPPFFPLTNPPPLSAMFMIFRNSWAHLFNDDPSKSVPCHFLGHSYASNLHLSRGRAFNGFHPSSCCTVPGLRRDQCRYWRNSQGARQTVYRRAVKFEVIISFNRHLHCRLNTVLSSFSSAYYVIGKYCPSAVRRSILITNVIQAFRSGCG